MSHQEPALIALSGARQQLAATNDVAEIRSIRDRAEAIRAYVKAAAMGLEAENRAAEMKLRAERKAGSLLAGLQLHGGDRKSSGRDARLKLRDLGVSQTQSKRWQKEAAVPIDVFEQYIERCHRLHIPITSSALLRMAKPQRQSAQQSSRSKYNTSETTAAEAAGNHRCSRFPSLVEELADHLSLLSRMLRPYGEGRTDQLKPAERRALLYYLDQMHALLDQLRQDDRREQ